VIIFKHFWKYKNQWQFWLRVLFLPVLLLLLVAARGGECCNKIFDYLNKSLPKINKVKT
jgi:hypothetical protein